MLIDYPNVLIKKMAVKNYFSRIHMLSFSLLSRLCFILIIFLFVNDAKGQSDLIDQFSDEELADASKKVNQLISEKQWETCEKLLVNITDQYKIKGAWDSVYHYNTLLSEVAHKSGNWDLEMRGYLDRVSQDRMFKKDTSEKYIEKVRYIFENLDTSKLSFKMLNQGYESHASYLFRKDFVDSSLVYSKRSLLMADKSNVPIVRITARLQHGIRLQYVKRYEEKLNILLEAEKIADEYVPDPIFKFRIYKDIGSLLLKISDLDKANYYLDKAISTADEANYSLFRADAEILKGKLLAERGQFDLSLSYFNKAIRKYKEVNYLARLPIVYVSLANMQLKAKQFDGAKTSLDSSLLYFSGNAITYKCALANYNLAIGKYSKVKEFLDSSKNELALEADYSDVYYMIKYKYYKSINSNKQALDTYEKYIQTRDSMQANFKDLKIHRIESEYNRNKQDIEISSLNKLNISQDKALAVRNTALWMGSIMLLMLCGLLFGLYRLYKRDQKNQKELAVQNKKISEALAQNQVLIKEIHHRVKNNLQVVSSLLSMQARKVNDGDTKDALNSSKTRVQSMSILHQNLYQGNDVTGVNIEEYLEKLVENIVDTYHIRENIKINIDIDPISLDVDTLVPLGLIANELICNALKYAFEGRDQGVLIVSFKSKENKMILRVADDGVGIVGDELPIKKGSLGARLIKSFSARLEGEIKIDNSNGTDISIVFDRANFKED